MANTLHERLLAEIDRGPTATEGRISEALRRVLEIHDRQPRRAGVNDATFGPGRCVMCWDGGPLPAVIPDRVFWGDVNGKDMWVHQHGTYPWCGYCDSEDGWPCSTLRAVSATGPTS